MAELVDYGGKLDPQFSHDKFAKEAILKLLKAYSEYMLRIDGFWYLTVMNKWGNDEALDCDIKAWDKRNQWEMQTISSILNIHGDDVATFMKYMQVSPWMWNYGHDIDLKNPNHAVLTINYCPTILSIEKEGQVVSSGSAMKRNLRFWASQPVSSTPRSGLSP